MLTEKTLEQLLKENLISQRTYDKVVLSKQYIERKYNFKSHKINEINNLIEKLNLHKVEKERINQIRKEIYEENYIKNISSEEFIKDYNYAIKGLDSLEEMLIKLLYDKNGLNGLTFKEISEYLGIPTNKVYNIKKKVIRKMNKNARFYKYINN